MSIHRRLTSLERRLPPTEPEGPEPEPVPLPSLAEFQAMPLDQQRYILLCWDPPPSGVKLPQPEELERMATEDLKRLMEEIERPGREALLPYAESLPMADRIQLLRDAVQLPGCDIWRLHTLRFACRPEWRRRLEGRSDQSETKDLPEGENP